MLNKIKVPTQIEAPAKGVYWLMSNAADGNSNGYGFALCLCSFVAPF